MEKEWVLAIRHQCCRDDVPFFFKQWGGVNKARTGRVLEGRTYDEFPSRKQSPTVKARDRLAAINETDASRPKLSRQSQQDLFSTKD
jgi:Protein of unknown function (DUF5131)